MYYESDEDINPNEIIRDDFREIFENYERNAQDLIRKAKRQGSIKCRRF